MSECKEHDYIFQHVIYWNDRYQIPGSSASERWYGDLFYCRRCLNQEVINVRKVGNSYQKPIDGTFPR